MGNKFLKLGINPIFPMTQNAINVDGENIGGAGGTSKRALIKVHVTLGNGTPRRIYTKKY